jgi:cellulose synthase/poly-beta-1,6-N-acetylglucosamine synthase-like glycosyltransferase
MIDLLILVGVLGLYLAIQIWQTATLFIYRDSVLAEPEEWPKISILVAARNEEKNIGGCLEALIHLDYPQNKIQIIVGNDQSTDRTRDIILEYSNLHSNIILVDVSENETGLKAKARVMAAMDTIAVGEYYLVTDADVRVNPKWAKHLVRHMAEETGVASGTTMVKSHHLWGKLQGIDWAYFMGLLNVISYNGVPATAVGNNMIVRKKAYWETGGYAAIKFSITEDYKLYSEVCKRNWKWNNIMTPETLAESAPTDGFANLIHQRKRWLSGGKELPWYWWILFGVFALWYFLLPLLCIISLPIGLCIWTIKIGLQMIQINKIHQLVGEKKPNFVEHIFYELYLFLITISTAIFFILPIKTIWKGRRY